MDSAICHACVTGTLQAPHLLRRPADVHEPHVVIRELLYLQASRRSQRTAQQKQRGTALLAETIWGHMMPMISVLHLLTGQRYTSTGSNQRTNIC
jgi:hypothetical protein